MLVYCLIFAPTLALTNSIAFANLKDSEKDFGKIRVWGTIGWIAAGWGLTGWETAGRKKPPGLAFKRATLYFWLVSFPSLWGIQAFSLPHTPPKKEAGIPYAFYGSFENA